jgi:para-nitrobenzyl esterase
MKQAMLLILGMLLVAVAPTWAQQISTPVITAQGPIRGEVVDNTVVFRGVPFARPPVGNLRWQAPQPAPLRTEILDALKFGNVCPQFSTGSEGIMLPGSQRTFMGNEDCLTLNIWTAQTATDQLRPVMVFIHGGGNVQGSSSRTIYDGRNLTQKGGVVLVTINYRLGALGFLAHPAFSAADPNDSSGNYGLLDQILALQWIQQNIQNFGGDPNNVTIFGESAGGLNVTSLIASPLAKGLFHKAIIESGGYSINSTLRDTAAQPERQSAEEFGLKFAEKLGCTGSNAWDCLRSKSAEQILNNFPGEASVLNRLEGGTVYGPNIDGYVFPDTISNLVRKGQHNNVPVMLGTNKNEGTIFITTLPLNSNAQYRRAVKSLFPEPLSRKVLKQYPVRDYATPRAAFDAIVTDLTFVCPTRGGAQILAASQPQIFMYNFTNSLNLGMARDFGAFHGLELSFVFNNFNFPISAEQRQLGDRMLQYWTNFAKQGDPNAAGLPTWPRYTPQNDNFLTLDTTITAGSGLRKTFCEFFAKELSANASLINGCGSCSGE